MGRQGDRERETSQSSREAAGLGAPGELRRCVIAPGNGCSPIDKANWYAWLQGELQEKHIYIYI